MKIKAKRLSDTAKLPTYGSEKAACADIYCDLRVDKCIDLNPANVDFKHMEYSGDCFDRVHIAPHETIKLPIRKGVMPSLLIYCLELSIVSGHCGCKLKATGDII